MTNNNRKTWEAGMVDSLVGLEYYLRLLPIPSGQTVEAALMASNMVRYVTETLDLPKSEQSPAYESQYHKILANIDSHLEMATAHMENLARTFNVYHELKPMMKRLTKQKYIALDGWAPVKGLEETTTDLASDIWAVFVYLYHLRYQWTDHERCLRLMSDMLDDLNYLIGMMGISSMENPIMAAEVPKYSKVTKALNRIHNNKTIKDSAKLFSAVQQINSNMKQLRKEMKEAEKENLLSAICSSLLTLHVATSKQALSSTQSLFKYKSLLIVLNTLYDALDYDGKTTIYSDSVEPIPVQLENLIGMLKRHNPKQENIKELERIKGTLN